MKFTLYTSLLVAGFMAALLSVAVAAAQETCVEAPGQGYRQTIRDMVGGDELQVTVSDRFGGAVESVTWRGMEFINVWDHGRQISYAWSMDGYGECLNPTEPGSARDYQAATSTTELLVVCKYAENVLTTTARLAYWLAPGESGYCEGGATTAVNEAPLSDQVLQKTMSIGHRGIENVIVFEAEITNPTDYTFMRAEVPTGYLTHAFSSFWTFDPQTGALSEPESQGMPAPWSFTHAGSVPPILATEDGSFAMGAYFPGPGQPVNYGIYRATSANPDEETNKWHMVVEESPYPAGTYRYRTFAVVGTLQMVQDGLRALYELYPADFTPPEGYLDVASCAEIAGWAWDPGLPDEAMTVRMVELLEDGEEALIATVQAANFREDLVTALGDNGRHGFRLETPAALRDGARHMVRVYAVNEQEGAPDVALIPDSRMILCAAPEATATSVEAVAEREEATTAAAVAATTVPRVEETGAAPVDEVTEQQAEESGLVVCGLPLLIAGVAVVGFRRRGAM